MKHKSEDYKLAVVKYYSKHKTSMKNACNIFGCSKKSLSRWYKRYTKDKSIKRYNKKSISYKITKEQVKYALELLNQNEQITMIELKKLIRKKFDTFDISHQHLGYIIRHSNRTRKRTRHEHFPNIRYNRSINKNDELKKFYTEIHKQDISKIISLDETSIRPAMIPEYSRCYLGKRCIYKTDDSYIFRSFTLLVAINNNKCVGYKLYEKGGMTKERLQDFLNLFIVGKYTNNLIVLDNAGSHNNELIKNTIINSNNKYLFSVPYTPKTNPIEGFFNQLKYYLKLNKKVLKFNDIETEINNAIKLVKPVNYKNYFEYAYKIKNNQVYKRKKSTRKKKKLNFMN
jgi:transposase